jgi:type 1 glutamine amidotransferase
VETKLFPGKVPDIAELKGAAVIVMESSGDRTPVTEHHSLFPQVATTDGKGYDPAAAEKFKQVDNLMKSGTGMVVLHYATYVINETARNYFNDWIGGYYESGVSKTVVGDWKVAPPAVKHPILQGITPWTYREEFYILNHLVKDDPRRTNLLMATPATGDPALVSWAVQREGGGRGFVMTGVDWHKHMLVDQHRTLLLNGIMWAAQMEVPAGGAKCTVPPEMVP